MKKQQLSKTTYSDLQISNKPLTTTSRYPKNHLHRFPSIQKSTYSDFQISIKPPTATSHRTSYSDYQIFPVVVLDEIAEFRYFPLDEIAE